jgi:hypothetical protein
VFFRPNQEREEHVARLVKQLRGNPDQANEAELTKLVEQEFDDRHAAQLREAEALAQRLARLQERLKKRQANKAEIVSRRIKYLLGQPDDLDWDVTPPTAAERTSGRSRSLFQRNAGAPLGIPASSRGRGASSDVADPTIAPPAARSQGPGTGLPTSEASASAAPISP